MPLSDSSMTCMRAVRPWPSPAVLPTICATGVFEVSRFSCMKFLGVLWGLRLHSSAPARPCRVRDKFPNQRKTQRKYDPNAPLSDSLRVVRNSSNHRDARRIVNGYQRRWIPERPGACFLADVRLTRSEEHTSE